MPQLRSIVAVLALPILPLGLRRERRPHRPWRGRLRGRRGRRQHPTVKENPSFAGDIMEAFNRNGRTSGGCHGSGEGGLTLTDASTSHASLVNVTSPVSREIRVIPGDAANSYLVKKLDRSAGSGAQMPLGGSPLGSVEMTNIRNWINNGAPNN